LVWWRRKLQLRPAQVLLGQLPQAPGLAFLKALAIGSLGYLVLPMLVG
jgi:hypothetical protein